MPVTSASAERVRLRSFQSGQSEANEDYPADIEAASVEEETETELAENTEDSSTIKASS